MEPNLTQNNRTRVLFGIILCVALYVVFAVITKVLIPQWLPQLSSSYSLLISRLLFWLYTGAIWFYALRSEGQPLLLWGEQRVRIWIGVASVFLILFAIFVGSGIIAVAIKYMGLHQQSSLLKSLYSAGIPLKLFIVFTAAITEELIFRGYLLPRLQLYFKSIWPPILISTLIFGFAHIGYGTLINVLVPLLVGFVFAWYYQKFRNIKILMICHFIIDFSALILLKA